jgi:hypothetical protein
MPPATKETLVKVMVVEDNAELRQFICEILSGTYRVVGVADGVMALESKLKIIFSNLSLSIHKKTEGNVSTNPNTSVMILINA